MPRIPAPETDWYVETTMRSMRAARCSGASAVTSTIVVQLGQDAMPFGRSRRSSGLTSATTSGTSGSIRNAAELSMTFAPAAAATGAHSSAIGSSTSTITRSSPSKHPARAPRRSPRRRRTGACGPPTGRRVDPQLGPPGTSAPRGSAASPGRPGRSRRSTPTFTPIQTLLQLASSNATCSAHRRSRRRTPGPRTRSGSTRC